MKYYIEITLLPTAEIPLYFLWEKLYRQIHLALVENQDHDGKVTIGSSFPEYNKEQHQLGSKLRLFAHSQKDLKLLQIDNWLKRLTDYVHISTIRNTPEKINEHAVFKRIQPKSNKGRLARRKAKREGITIKQATTALSEYKEQTSQAPYIRIRSLSSDKRYRLMIARVEKTEDTEMKTFSTYGLSAMHALPLF